MQKRLVSQGFTIIETLLVLSVIAIIAALALPRLDGAAKERELNMVAQNLVSDIRLVQQLNINSGGIAANEVQLYFLKEGSGQYYYLIRRARSIDLKKVYLPKTISWNSPKTVQFTVSGAPAVVSGTSASQTITLKNSDGKLLYIKIAPVTGRVRITDVANTENE